MIFIINKKGRNTLKEFLKLNINLRCINEEQKKALKKIADKNKRSLNSEILIALELYLLKNKDIK